ncbi:uncharacterized protein LOC112187388 isoform X2 [Rosa chinensis]|uniref:uncharacterized protein LOC112187388 isoform X2 n=1 Tax=Rosa chinensis TaxID=74649 RepID=UPI001AD90FDA|nr:uncharacterized protein LOC112187388 isoform X2 [Rosa chinensis]
MYQSLYSSVIHLLHLGILMSKDLLKHQRKWKSIRSRLLLKLMMVGKLIKIVRFFYVGGRLEAALAEHEISGLNFLSINRFERKKNIDLAISAFAMLRTLEGDVLHGLNLAEASLTIAGKFLLIFCPTDLIDRDLILNSR